MAASKTENIEKQNKNRPKNKQTNKQTNSATTFSINSDKYWAFVPNIVSLEIKVD